MGRRGEGLVPPPLLSSPVVHLDDDPEHDKKHGQASQADAEDEHDSFIHDPPSNMAGTALGQFRLRVCPGLDGCKDGVIAV